MSSEESVSVKANEVVSKAKEQVAPFFQARASPDEGAVTPLRPGLSWFVSTVTDAADKVEVVGGFVRDIASDSSAFVREKMVKPSVETSIQHPELLAVGTATAGALLRARKGVKKMVRGGVIGGAAGLAFLFYELY